MADQKCRSDGFDYKRIHKVITWRETRHMRKGHVTGRGGETKALIFMCFSWATEQISLRGGCTSTLLHHTPAAS